jgi:hypothetical protein
VSIANCVIDLPGLSATAGVAQRLKRKHASAITHPKRRDEIPNAMTLMRGF